MDEHHWMTSHGYLLAVGCDLLAGKAPDEFAHSVWLCEFPFRVCKSSLKFSYLCKLPHLANLVNIDG
jgi:hypothetical protein